MTRDRQPYGDGDTPWPDFPEIEAEIGENPAKFLVGQHLPPAARIRGLDSVKRVNAYLRVEAKTRRRQDVIARLNRQKKRLKEREDAKEAGPTEFEPASEMRDGQQQAAADGGGETSELADELEDFPPRDREENAGGDP